ncbi:hypothetical protein NK718_03135 [Alsobacter sp. SYSU M60028]|uniref:Uncharacterized protein n=1 Tax=Alsobacter ponti TaxID=2962936 RepID=A0ABT1L8Y6_9HYPH|nr:hypothetical protein [Alsobacter ponti]MCP8937498.1 hypothetical protein [Alsobacter ponti]
MRMRVAVFVLLLGGAFPARAELPKCSCSDFDKLQQELDNATTLRDRHKAKAEELERRHAGGESWDKLGGEYAAWETDVEKGAGAGIQATAEGNGSASISYVPKGVALISSGAITGWSSPVTSDGYTKDVYDAAKAHAIEASYKAKGVDLCEFSNPEAVRKSADDSSFCKGVSDITMAHEESHRATCRKMGFIAFYLRDAAQLARDEVTAYDGQIAALQDALGKALKGAEVEFEDVTNITYSGQMALFQYKFAVEKTRGAIPDNDGKSWSLNLKGVHRTTPTNFRVAGSTCTMNAFTRSVDMAVAASGKEAKITFTSFGPTPKITISCKGGRGMGSAGTDPSGESVDMPLKLSSTVTSDLSKSKVATMMKGMMTVTGKQETSLRIICPAK